MDITKELVYTRLRRNLAVQFARPDWVKTMVETVFEYLESSDKLKCECNVNCLDITVEESMPPAYTKLLLSLLKDFTKDRDAILSMTPGMNTLDNKIIIVVNNVFFDPNIDFEKFVTTTN